MDNPDINKDALGVDGNISVLASQASQDMAAISAGASSLSPGNTVTIFKSS